MFRRVTATKYECILHASTDPNDDQGKHHQHAHHRRLARRDTCPRPHGGRTVGTARGHVRRGRHRGRRRHGRGADAGGCDAGLLSAADDAGHAYARNASLFCAAVDLSCVTTAGPPGGTLIAPRMILGTAHLPASGPHYFVTPDNQTVGPFDVIDSRQIPDISGMWVGLLDAAVPTSVTPARVLPAAWRSYLPGQFRVPVAWRNQFPPMAPLRLDRGPGERGHQPAGVRSACHGGRTSSAATAAARSSRSSTGGRCCWRSSPAGR
jgi:hypothetical protein